MEEKARRSVPVSILSYAVNQGLRLVATVVLARILVPSDFGLFALTSLAISLLSIFNDFGVGPALVVARNLDRRTRATALTLMIAASLVLAAVLVVLAPLAAELFDEDQLDELLLVVAGSLFLSGPIWFHETTLQRDLEFVKRFGTKLVQTLTYITVAITLALLDAGVWSLVIGHVTSYVAYLAALVAVSQDRVAPGWDRAAARRLAGSGRGFLAQDALEYAQAQSDAVAVGGFLGTGQLGLYAMGFRFGELTYIGIAEPITQVTFPTFSRMRERGENWRASFRTVLRLVSLITFPIGALFSGAAEPIVETLLGDKWSDTIGPLAVFGVWAMLKPLEGTFGWLLNSLEQQARLAKVRALGLIPFVPALFIAADLGGITAVAWVMVAHMAGLTIALSLTVRSRAQVALHHQLRAVAPAAAGAVAAWAAARGTAVALDDAAPILALVAAGAACLAAFAVGASLVERRVLPDALERARATLRRSADPAAPERSLDSAQA
jgi:PST family polysaccharide transporter